MWNADCISKKYHYECGQLPGRSSISSITIYNIDCNARYIVCVIYFMYLNTFCEKGSVGFTRLSKGSMAQKKVKNPFLRLYNSCTSMFIKENLFLTFKCQQVYKCFVVGNSKISVLKKWNKKGGKQNLGNIKSCFVPRSQFLVVKWLYLLSVCKTAGR